MFSNSSASVSRRTSSQFHWACKTRSEILDRKDALKYAKREGWEYRTDRYKAVNNTNSNTVEIRIMRGTLKLETFLASIDFILTVAKNSKRIRWDNANDEVLWLKGAKPETMEYIASKGAFPKAVAAYENEKAQNNEEREAA